jgi:putative peptide zinc metalloprotease protein
MQPGPQEQRLPRLRPDLELLEGAPSPSGEPTWVVRDPLQNKYIQIDRATYEVLSVWSQCETRAELSARLGRDRRLARDDAQVEQLIDFLTLNQLVDAEPGSGWRLLSRLKRVRRRSTMHWLLHNYLFFKLPLIEPQSFLVRTLPAVRPLASRKFLIALAITGALGVYLVSRQWEQFLVSASAAVSWEGMLVAVVAIVVAKVAHEMGHAYTAVAHGCHVPTMGIAFMMLAPLLYTDVTSAWRLRDRHARLAIGSAGIRVEAGIACIALFAWSFLPVGALRNAAFVMAAVGLISSLVINLNPLMRFDGYHMLGDWLGIENLQDRAFAMARWRLREILFDIGAEPPDVLPAGRRTTLIALGWATWVYRAALFIGIALVVYQFFFKALGLLLFAFEIIYFVARPLGGEFAAWYALRKKIAVRPRTAITVACALIVLGLAVVPWSSSVAVPAVLEPLELARLHSVRPAYLAAVHVKQGQAVEAGAEIATLISPEIRHELETTRIRLRLARQQFARRIADAADRESSLEIEQSISMFATRIEGLEREAAELVLRAPFAGRIVEMSPEILPGVWLGTRTMVAMVANTSRWAARGYVEEADSWRISPGSKGVFVPELSQRASLPVVVRDLAQGGASQIDVADLASLHGGRVQVTTDDRRRFIPVAAQYPVVLDVDGGGVPAEMLVRGTGVIAGQGESFLYRIWRRAVVVVLRESGF